MIYFSRRLGAFVIMTAAAAVVAAPSPADAAQEIVLTSDQSQILKLPEAPATLLLGNPSVADVTTDGTSLFLHPRGYGLTNLIALDSDGKKLGDYLIRVIYEDSYSLSMYSPGSRKTYSCRRDCQTTLRIGDADSFFSNYASQLQSKNSLAQGQPMGETRPDSSPVAPPPGTPIIVTAPQP